MTEQPRPQVPDSWSPTEIANALGARQEPRVDHVLGTGLRFHLGQPPGTDLELFPDAGVVRIATPDVHVSLVRQHSPVLSPDGIIFISQSVSHHQKMCVCPNGDITLEVRATSVDSETPADASLSAKQHIAEVDTDEPASDDPAAPESPSGDGSDPESTPEAQPRVSLRGRLGSAPRFRTTPKELLIGRFPLAVSVPESDTTEWHKVVAFGDRAARLQADELRKGELVSVVGYEHERTFTDKEGNERTEVELFAAVIKRA